MNNFFRVVRIALRRRFTFAAAILCSLCVALLWGANLGLVKPLIEIVFSGRTPHQWIDWQTAQSRGEIERLQAAIDECEDELATADDRAAVILRNDRGRMAFELGADEQSLHWLNRLEPYV